jgi:hypothetical protein
MEMSAQQDFMNGHAVATMAMLQATLITLRQRGSVYERTEVKILIRGTGQHSCVICDEVLET